MDYANNVKFFFVKDVQELINLSVKNVNLVIKIEIIRVKL